MLHPDEYILDANMTKVAEAVIGGRLSKSKILAVLAAGKQGAGKPVNVNQYYKYQFDGSLSPDERQWIRKITRQEASAGILDALGA
jgi:hypothetical protein